MEAPVFLFFCLSVGYLLYWVVVNDKRDPDGGHDGWFGIKRAQKRDPAEGGTTRKKGLR